jgi:Beta-propeller repeat
MHSAIRRVLYGNLKWTVFLLFLTCGQALAASAPTWMRAMSFGGSGSDSSFAVKVDADGNQYVTGSFSLSAVFGDRVLDSAGGSDFFLAKFDRSGELRWLLRAGGPGDDVGQDIAVDRAGNIYVTGSFTGSATFPSVHGPAKTVTGIGQTIFLAKYRPTGTLAWVQTGAVRSDFANNEGLGVAVEPDTGTVFITGRTQTDTTFSSSDGTEHIVPGAASWHMFLVKYDGDGKFQWGQSNEASPNCIPHKVAIDERNNAYVTGWLEGATTFHSNDGHDLTITGLSPAQSTLDFPDDAFIVKYDAEGNAKWVNVIGGYKGIATDIAVSDEGKISITGFIGNVGSGMPAEAQTIATSQPGGKNINLGGGQLTDPYNKDAFVATYNSAGVLLKARRIGGRQEDGGSGIAYDRKGNLYVTGVFQGTVHVYGHTLTGEKPFNLFVLKFRERSREEHGKQAPSAAGELAWIKKADGPGHELFEQNPRMCVTSAHKVLVTGIYSDTAVFDAIHLQSAGQEDIFLAELNAGHDNEDCDDLGCGERDDD